MSSNVKNPAGNVISQYLVHGAKLSRRRFLGGAGALVTSVVVNPGFAAAQTTAQSTSLDASKPNSWIEIHADNTALIRTGKCDFGQSSIFTAYRQIVAEELSLPVENITTVIWGDTDVTPDGGGTFGLLRGNVQNLRKAAAYTREAIKVIAAEHLNVSVSAITIDKGQLSAGGKALSYGEIVANNVLSLEIPVSGELTSFRGVVVTGEPPFKPKSEYSTIGQPLENPITPPKVRGDNIWVGDVKLPGMVHARVIHPATLGSTLIKPGTLDNTKFPNSKLVTINNLLAVVSDNEWEAVKAAMAVAPTTQWSDWQGIPTTSDELEQYLRGKKDSGEVAEITSSASKGDVNIKSAKTLTANYFVPYHKHAPIGPMVSVAEVKNGNVVIHTHSQNPQFLRMAIAKMLKEDEANVIIKTYVGPGHFGRSNGGNAGSEDEAALLSVKLGVPVRVQWMRQDDMQWSTSSSTMVADIAIGLDEKGKINSYKALHIGPPMQDDRPVGAILAGTDTIGAPSPDNPSPLHGASIFIADAWVYGAVDNVSENGQGMYQLGQKESPTNIGIRDHSMRTPIQYQQNFPRETAMSEAAALAGMDAIDFRLAHTTEPRFKAILTRLKDEANWETRPSPSPQASSTGEQVVRGRGVSIMLRDNGYWACAANIAVVPSSGEVKVEKMTLVSDTGIVVNPLQLRRQAEAGCIMGVSQALHEEVSFDNSKITSQDWYSYPILKMSEVPEIKVVIAPDANAEIYGQGSESANALASSAIAGAFFDATGKPIRRLPLKPAYVKAALSS
ncbi:xanthine dehydrogenase family protein molybdopterin-binding subunit [Alteromonas confluentis]|uniref:Twin-arginine translocation pathway signal protein n=1 Tax=Alteromonas confluentis TaxID=1656094 RepID=A0A1E7ZGW9_9ALTE|nr:molybdopterin cofactor-binding domain-containing protein [Alteromonas confluentis]OFC72710.1 twin-arginine translocation pathway signal protein [Alteromonas confluentis]